MMVEIIEQRMVDKGGRISLTTKVAASRQRFSATPSPGLRPGPHISTVEVVV
jgi:hypothetical protein